MPSAIFSHSLTLRFTNKNFPQLNWIANNFCHLFICVLLATSLISFVKKEFN